MAKNNSWKDKVINHAQLGGIETSVLDNGLGKGCRVAWVNAGALRYKVAIDRAMDIVEAFYNGHSLAFLTHGATVQRRYDVNYGLDWLQSFNGGLLATCGLQHFGGPETDDKGLRGLHGRIGNISAEVESVVNPDLLTEQMEMSISGVVKETSMFGANLELRRKISSSIGQSVIRIHDEVVNVGNSEVQHMLLYHCNFGYPLIDEGTEIIYKGTCKSRGAIPTDDEIFKSKNDYKKCHGPMDSHRGFGEACGLVDIKADKSGMCTAGLYNPRIELAAALRFKKEQLPYMWNWQHFGYGEYVVGMEPATNGIMGQNNALKAGELIMLKPGQKRVYDLEIEIMSDPKKIAALRK